MKKLVGTGWLAAHLADPDLRVFDCTMLQTPDPLTTYRIENRRDAWAAAHIPGAGYMDLAADLSDRSSSLRFMLPPVEVLADALSRLGVGDDTPVVLYSTSNASWATRAWWVLRCAGCANVAVLDGGFAKWRAEERPVSDEPCRYPPATFTPRMRPGLVCDKAAVLAAIGDARRVIVNALTPEQHAGTGGTQYGRAGHIAGSVNLPWRDLTDAVQGTFLPAAQLRTKFECAGIAPSQEVLVYCGGGIAASAAFLALELAGFDRLRLYDASLQEWAADPALPMERE